MENQIGEIRKPRRTKDRELAKLELISAVGEIIRTKGYTGLGVNQIAKQAGLHKKLIYNYFGDVDSLIEQYVIEKDFWLIASEDLGSKATVNSEMDLKGNICSILMEQFDFFYQEQEMQELILWELSGKSHLMTSISNVREGLGEKVLTVTDQHFKDSEVNFRAVSAILTSAIYYLILHSKVSTFCGLNIQATPDREEILKTLRFFVDVAFDHAKKSPGKMK